MSQVVHDYGDVCQAITDLAVEAAKPISADDFRTLNRCLDDAIAGAVTEYGRERDEPNDRGAAAGDYALFTDLARDLAKPPSTGGNAMSPMIEEPLATTRSSRTWLVMWRHQSLPRLSRWRSSRPEG